VSVESVTSIENFFHYGKGDLLEEIKHDLLVGMLQPKRRAFYFRDYGAGADVHENAPVSVVAEVGIAFDVVDFIARRNGRVSDGSGGGRDRRVAASQSQLSVRRSPRGQIDVSVMFVPYFDYENPVTLSTLGGEA
jgi:hypothetical protein